MDPRTSDGPSAARAEKMPSWLPAQEQAARQARRARRMRLAVLLVLVLTTIFLSLQPQSLFSLVLLLAGRCLGHPPSEVPYYGRSPPVYPSPPGNGSSSAAWAAAYSRARALVAQMTVEEQANLTVGYPGRCVGNSGAVPRLGVRPLCFSDGPAGVRAQGEAVSAFPAGQHLAATFDADLFAEYGAALGREFAAHDVDVALGPVAGPLGRLARGGRNWEGLSSDPYLAGVALAAVTRGLQAARVVATPKHFLLNEQEFRRRDSARQPERGGGGHIRGEAVSSNVDDRTLHELYAFPFAPALAAAGGHAAAVMCSYQRANHSYGCQNAKLLNGVLKTELAFAGFVVSDWDAQHSGVAAAAAGLDVAMPASHGFWADGLLARAVHNGSVEAARVADMATRLLAAWYVVGGDARQSSAADAVAAHALIRRIGAAGTVLVKNTHDTLPFRRPRLLAVYGYDAVVKAAPWADPMRFGGGYGVNAGWNTLNGTLITGGGSGGGVPPFVVSPFQALQERAAADGTAVRWDFYAEAPPVESWAPTACLVFINAYASESFDRPSLTDDASDRLVRHVAARCGRTVVVVHAAGIRVVDAWIDHENVTAVLFAGLPGQAAGHSLADVLYGHVNPSGRLPYTVARREADYGALLNSSVSTHYFPDDDFAEGLYIDYRAFDRQRLQPRFPFGFGLSYTTFAYGPALEAEWTRTDLPELPDPAVPLVQGGHPHLWDTVATVRLRIANSGDVAGSEVVQLYIGVPGADADADADADDDDDSPSGDTPVRQLRGFRRVGPLDPGAAEHVQLALTRRDLSVWDVVAQQWRLRRGVFRLYVGASSRDLRLNGTLTI